MSASAWTGIALLPRETVQSILHNTVSAWLISEDKQFSKRRSHRGTGATERVRAVGASSAGLSLCHKMQLLRATLCVCQGRGLV